MKSKEYGKEVNNVVYDKATLLSSRKSDNLFTRKSVLSFAVILLFLLNMQKTALQARGNSFFGRLFGGFRVRVSKQAISQRRNSFDHTPFVTMMQRLVTKEYSGNYKTELWNGYHVLAVDGSYLQLPREEDLRQAFGVRGSDSFPMAGVSILYDVLHGWPIDATITHADMNERSECEAHINFLCDTLPHVAKNSILTLDRGYPSKDMYSFLEEKGIKFVIRCSSKALAEINNAPVGDSIIKLGNGQKLRVIKIAELFGSEYILATNLFDVTIAEIIELYHMRWGIETMFKILKEHLFIEGFSGKTENSILQDFYATMVILIGVAIFQKEGNEIARALRKNKKNKHEVSVNISNIVSTMRDRFISIVLFGKEEGFREEELYDIIYKIANSVESIRKNRQFPRIPRPRNKAKHNLKTRA